MREVAERILGLRGRRVGGGWRRLRGGTLVMACCSGVGVAGRRVGTFYCYR